LQPTISVLRSGRLSAAPVPPHGRYGQRDWQHDTEAANANGWRHRDRLPTVRRRRAGRGPNGRPTWTVGR